MRVTQRARNSRSWETSTTPPRRPAHERLEPLEAVEVEVVGGLVEQHDVEAAQQQRGERRAGRLAARERGHRGASGPTSRPRSASTGGRRSSRSGAPLASQWSSATAYASSAASGSVRRRAPRRRPPSPRSPRRRARAAARCSRRPSRRRRARAPAAASPTKASDGRGRHRAGQRRRLAGEQPQQGGLAGAVGPDDADDVARGDGQVEGLEEGAVAVATGQVLRDEGAGHGPRVVRRSVG